MITLRYRARPGSLLTDPRAPGRYLGRSAKPTPADGWPQGTKKEEIYAIDSAGAEVRQDDRERFMVVLDALRKGIDLEPADDATAKYVGVEPRRTTKPSPAFADHRDHGHGHANGSDR